MASTSTSKILLEANGLSMDFPVNLYPQHGLRDTFIELIKGPFDYLTRGKEVLPVIRDLSLNLNEGDRLGILGNNGAGKTTLCRILCGMIHPQRGQVKVHGQVEAFFDTSTGILPELTGRENAHLLMELFPHKEIAPKYLEEALKFSELDVFLDAPYKTYSKGMQARLMLSLISMSSSDVLILDEVFDGADIFFKEKIGARMKEKINRSGAVIFVSHSPDQILELCNRVVVLEKGTIAFDGAPQAGVEFYLSSQR